jgi:iron only hydrogenase large subunit-like protein
MPCYDKKLEASRQDFYNDLYSSRDVDCVITTGELELLMREKGWDVSRPVDRESNISNDIECVEIPELLSHPGTSSGSYLHSLITELIAASSEPLDLSVRTVRTSDYEEYTLRNLETKQIVFRGAKCYGFRNLQNVVRKVGREAGVQVGKGAAGKMVGGLRARTRKMENGPAHSMEPEKGYDYVEVMACPGGCVNGGGQLRPPGSISNKTALAEGSKTDQEVNVAQFVEQSRDGDVQASLQNPKWLDKDWTKKVEEAYWHDLPTPPASPKLYAAGGARDILVERADRLSTQILVDICMPKEVGEDFMWSTRMDDAAEARRRQFFRTQYHAVESEAIGLGVKW